METSPLLGDRKQTENMRKLTPEMAKKENEAEGGREEPQKAPWRTLDLEILSERGLRA